MRALDLIPPLLSLLLVLPFTRAVADESESSADGRRSAVEWLGLNEESLTEEERSLLRRPDENRPATQLGTELWGRPLTIGGSYNHRSRALSNSASKDSQLDDLSIMSQALTLDAFYRLTESTSLFLKANSFYRSKWQDFEGHPLGRDDARDRRRGFARDEMWLFVRGIGGTPLSLQVGRQRFTEPREWFWDDDMDAVRLHFDRPQLHLELSLARLLARVDTTEPHLDPEEEDVTRLLASAVWEWAPRNRLSFFALHQRDASSTEPSCQQEDDVGGDLAAAIAREIALCGNFCEIPAVREALVALVTAEFEPPPASSKSASSKCQSVKSSREDESDANLWWFGSSARGRWKAPRLGRLDYWVDAAMVSGTESFVDYAGAAGNGKVAAGEAARTRHGVHGWALDVGATLNLPLPGKPALTLGYAIGSGDRQGKDLAKKDHQEASDRSFRQTGLEDNNGRFRGVNRFRYYGELLEPELSNLRIGTAALGFRFGDHSSVELLYHSYRQDYAAKFLRHATVRRQPAGRKRGIGHEFDLVIGLEEWERIEIELIAAAFRAGPAYAAHLDGNDEVPASAGDWTYLAFLKFKINF